MLSAGIESSSADDPTLLWKEVGESLLLSKKGMLNIHANAIYVSFVNLYVNFYTLH